MLAHIKAKATNTGKKWVPKAQSWDSVEEDEETWVGSGSSSNGDDSSHEEANWSCTSEEETDALKAFNILKACKKLSSNEVEAPFQALFQHIEAREVEASKQEAAPTKLSSNDAPEVDPSTQKPARTKLSSNALVFVPGVRTSAPTSVPGTKSGDAGRDLLTLLKSDLKDSPNEKDCPKEMPSENQQKPQRTKLSSSANVFVPRANVVQSTGFVPRANVVQPTGFVPMMAVLMPITMCTNNDNNNGFDDSPQVTPRMTHPDSEPEEANDAESDSCGLHEDLTDSDSIQQSDHREEVSSKPPAKTSWADLYEDDEDFGTDLWLDTSAKNELLSLS